MSGVSPGGGQSRLPCYGDRMTSPVRLMTTPASFVLSRLSRTLYEAFVAKAQKRKFSFVLFSDFLPGTEPLPDRYIVLRHDIDFAPSYSLEMAELEHAYDIRSTYFVLVDGQFYNAMGRDELESIRAIHALGHEIGLHFTVAESIHENLGVEVAYRMNVLGAMLGHPVRSFSQHDPVNAGFAHVTLPPEHAAAVDASDVIRDNNLLYVSDSAMMWRQHTFETALDVGRNLCLLAHPHSWLHSQDDYVAMIREFELHERHKVASRFDAFVGSLSGYYAQRALDGI